MPLVTSHRIGDTTTATIRGVEVKVTVKRIHKSKVVIHWDAPREVSIVRDGAKKRRDAA